MNHRQMFAALALVLLSPALHAGTAALETIGEALQAAGGPLRQVSFEDVMPDTAAPFASLGVVVEEVDGGIPGQDPPVVTDDFSGNHFNWFFGYGSPARFLVSNLGFSATFPAPVRVAGVSMRSIGCVDGQSNRMGWRIFDATDALVDSGVLLFDEGCPGSTLPVYVGLHAAVPFQRVEFHREGGANFLVDDLQYGPIEGLSDQVDGSFPPAFVAGFDDVPVDTTQPILSGDLIVTGPAQVTDQFFGFPHASVFGGKATPPNMLTTHFAFVADAPGEIGGLRFFMAGGGCHAGNFATVEAFDAALRAVDSVAFAATGCVVQRLGVLGIVPAHRLHVRVQRTGSGFVNAAIDDLELSHFRVFFDGFE
ncbi:MAG TPA: hypothetical protein PKZ76_11595 [Xanthomonadaceae bacterium]|nr:hypothetical protein [Xanthomonadaceae bacterium]